MNKTFRDIVARRNFVVLDTETTGIVQPAEIVQIAIIDCDGRVMMDKLVHPINPIPPAATAIHSITNEMVERAQFWLTVKHDVLDLIAGCDVIVYNATYDRKLMHWSDEASGLSHTDYKEKANWYCAMEAYAEYHGEKHPYYGSYKWQSLSNAMMQQGLPISDAHNALGDCLMTLQLINKLCK